jgi:ubiquitin-conjugating enzyme E2 Z
VKQILKNPLNENGIYYEHDDENMLKGYALIVGQSDTPYFGGFYFFQFDYPTNYPFSPPSVTYMTNNGETRFHPNLYISGKVCVSILNTWCGDKWSSCQTISSVLLTLCSLLTDNPLLNEPGQMMDSMDMVPYTKSISFQNINYAMCDIFEKTPEKFKVFQKVMCETFLKNYEIVYDNVSKQTIEPVCYKVFIYKMQTIVNYNELKEKMEKTKERVLFLSKN